MVKIKGRRKERKEEKRKKKRREKENTCWGWTRSLLPVIIASLMLSFT